MKNLISILLIIISLTSIGCKEEVAIKKELSEILPKSIFGAIDIENSTFHEGMREYHILKEWELKESGVNLIIEQARIGETNLEDYSIYIVYENIKSIHTGVDGFNGSNDKLIITLE